MPITSSSTPRTPEREVSTRRPILVGPLGNAFRLEAEQVLEAPLEQVFAYFAEPRNLERITPPWLRFRIVGEPPSMGVGAVIDYRLRLHGVPIPWRSEITEWEPPHRFVDVQRRGPFTLWAHEHTFRARGDLTVIRDVVDYDMILPRLANRLLVRRDLQAIFEHRQRVVGADLGAVEHARTP
jgi:hypothetical protein